MRLLPAATALAVALTVPAGTGTAAAHTPSAPADLPAGTWFGEARSGTYDARDVDGLADDPITTLHGARLLLKFDRVTRPDGETGPAWLWFDTRPRSTFALTGCDRAGVVDAVRVARKRLQAAVRSGAETDFVLTYDARANSGDVEVAVSAPDSRPRLPGCLPAAETPVPERPEFAGPDFAGEVMWSEGSSFEGRADDSEGAELQVLDGEWLVVSYTREERVHRWYGTRGASRFFLNFCSADGEREFPVQVPREEFLQRVTTVPTQSVAFRYDAERDLGRFVAGSWTDEQPCEVRER